MFNDYQPKFKNLPTGTILADVANHCPNFSYFRVAGDASTSAHEGTHGIHAAIRNANGGKPSFYALNNQSITLDELAGHKHDCIRFIPESLKFARYSLYVAGQTEWDSTPSYLFDEAIAYVNGAACAIEIDKSGDLSMGMQDMLPPPDLDQEPPDYLKNIPHCSHSLWEGDGSDRIFGAIEFIGYCTAVLMAAGPLAPLWVQFAKWHFTRAMQLHKDGKAHYPWADEDKCVDILTKSQDPLVVAMRNFQLVTLDFDISGEHHDDNYFV